MNADIRIAVVGGFEAGQREEHARKWSGFKSGTEDGIVPLLDMTKAFSGDFFRRRLDADYVSHMRGDMMELISALQNRGSSWQLPRT